MNQLINTTQNLPTTIEDLSQFVLVGREKLTSVRAEIRAIDKLNLAQEVRDQKREECSMLAEALLDAEVKIGDLLKQIPKDKSFKGNQHTCSIDTDVDSPKPKHEVITDLGFNQKQAERFETLAANKDLVEQVKAEARENDDIPTRTRVLELAKARKQKEQDQPVKEPDDYAEYCRYIDECKKISGVFIDFFLKCSLLKVDDKTLNMWKEFLRDNNRIEKDLEIIEEFIPKLLKVQSFLKELIK